MRCLKPFGNLRCLFISWFMARSLGVHDSGNLTIRFGLIWSWGGDLIHIRFAIQNNLQFKISSQSNTFINLILDWFKFLFPYDCNRHFYRSPKKKKRQRVKWIRNTKIKMIAKISCADYHLIDIYIFTKWMYSNEMGSFAIYWILLLYSKFRAAV